MKKTLSNHGFTLVELVVVGVIIGILATIAVSRATRVMEGTRARNAMATVIQLGNAHRMLIIDTKNTNVYGQLLNEDSTTSDKTCQQLLTNNSPRALIKCNYAADQDWGKDNDNTYNFYLCSTTNPAGACCSKLGDTSEVVACAKRNADSKIKPSVGSANWTYVYDSKGSCRAYSSPCDVNNPMPSSEVCPNSSNSDCK